MRRTLTALLLCCAGIGNADDRSTETSPCPGLVASYDVESFEQVLVVTDADFASTEDCERLGGFYFTPKQVSNRTMDYAGLGAIVDSIWQPLNRDTPYVLVEALLSWLRDLGFDQHVDSLREFFDTYMPPGETVELFFTLLIWLVVIATAVLVLREFYRAGVFGRAGRPARRTRAEPAEHVRKRQWREVLALPLREQISALLQYSLEQLAAGGLIPAARSYTNRELVARLERADARKAGLLREQVELTEPVIYGDEPVSDARLAACRDCSRKITDA